jgi:hypothetical protein
MADSGDALLANDAMQQRPGKGDKVGRLDYPRGPAARALRRADQPAPLSAQEQEIAKVFGLVLGSPEFQRR